MKIARSWLFSSLSLVLFLNPAWGWNKHHFLMAPILSAPNPALKQILERTAQAPCEADDKARLDSLIFQLQLNSASKIPATTDQSCGVGTQLSVYSVLLGSSVDDPDGGMDQNLPSYPGNSFDPHEDRKWMGGVQGPTSQGFRHMLFGGWSPFHPITTFQIPFRSVGQSPVRMEVLAQKAKELLKSGDLIWGTRVLAWSMHYIQDLNQPFHAVQLPSLKMVPWHVLLAWPPQHAFHQLVQETTRVITNFHYAYEGYTLNQVLMGDKSPLAECLNHPENYTTLKFDSKTKDLKALARAVASASIQNAPLLGSSEFALLGTQLMKQEVDLGQTPDLINYDDLAIRPDLNEPRKEFHQVTCIALANTSLATRYLLEWAFEP